MLLFIGRSNTQKNSAPLQELLNRLVLDGYLLVWPKSRNQFISELLANKSLRAVDWLNSAFGQTESQAKVWIRRILKGLILIGHPARWDYFADWLRNNQSDEQTETYREILRVLGSNKSIFILSHSAGGITASRLANEDNLRGMICFGYPFKHPDKDEEPYRTTELKNIEKPFLIVQGHQDEYGGADVQSQYELSQNIEFEFVQANHEYENLSTDDWMRVVKRLASFLEQYLWRTC
jgi:pimeloyl-ACP methyl ester carboxylesterase